MPYGLTFLVGGARSGKSNLAVELGVRHAGPVTFIATAEAFDDDMAGRIARHRSERPDWPTIEAPVDVAAAVGSVAPGHLVIIDCLTVWIGNLYARGSDDDIAARSTQVVATTERLIGVLSERVDPTIVISNEVGLGLHPGTALGREYRDDLGRLNQRIAALADRTLFLIAGRAIRLGDPLEMLS